MLITTGTFRPGKRGPALGWGISLLVHALAAAWLVHTWRPRPADGPPPARIDFVLVPRRAVPAAVPAPAAPPVRTTQRAVRRTDAAHVPAVAVAVGTPAQSATTVDDAAPAAVPAPADDAPAFDMAAARATARAAAREGTVGLVALPRRPPPTLDPARDARAAQLARGIARSGRHDCRTAYSGMGLLAVLPLLKDAVTGSGCKW